MHEETETEAAKGLKTTQLASEGWCVEPGRDVTAYALWAITFRMQVCDVIVVLLLFP